MDIKFESIIILLLTQAMINLGEIKNPIKQSVDLNIKGAKIFIELLKILKEKTVGNLTDEEVNHLNEIINNVEIIYNKKQKIQEN